MPTATISAAPPSSASSIATSSLVPEVGKVTASMPMSWTRASPGARPSAVGVHDHLGPAGERAIRDGVHVPDDHVRLVPRLEQRVSAAVDSDQHGLVLADVVLERFQVVGVVEAADDDDDVPPGELRLDRGDAHALEQQLALAAHELRGVDGEGLELGG